MQWKILKINIIPKIYRSNTKHSSKNAIKKKIQFFYQKGSMIDK